MGKSEIPQAAAHRAAGVSGAPSEEGSETEWRKGRKMRGKEREKATPSSLSSLSLFSTLLSVPGRSLSPLPSFL